MDQHYPQQPQPTPGAPGTPPQGYGYYYLPVQTPPVQVPQPSVPQYSYSPAQYPPQGYSYPPTQPAMPYTPYQYPNGYPIYPGNPYYYDPVLARKEYEKRLKIEQAKESLRYLGNISGLSVILFLAFNTVISLLLTVPGMMDLYQNNSLFYSAFSIVASFMYLFVPFSIIAALIRRRDKAVNFFPFKKMNSKRALLCIPIGAAACLLANVLTSLFVSLLENFGISLSQQSDTAVRPDTVPELLLAIACTAIMPALLEEYALRGVLLQPARRYGMVFAILSTSAIFGLMHGNLIQAPFAFLVGCCFAFLAIKCDSLWIGVILHFLNNGFSVLMEYLDKKLPELTYNAVYYVCVSVIALAGIVCLVVLIVSDKQFFKKTEGDAAKEEAGILSAGQKFVAYFVNAPMIISFVLMALLTLQYIAKK